MYIAQNKAKIRIGTRSSQLAIIQAQLVQQELMLHNIKSTIITIKTTGDKITNKTLYDIGGKALFLKELEEALLAGEIDMAVHSMKDVPATLPENLAIKAVLKRLDPRDVLVSKFNSIKSLPFGSIVGSSSVRRIVQILQINPHVTIKNIRGNVDSRLTKYFAGEYDAILLAQAGLTRLNLQHEDFHLLTTKEMIPAVGQGIIAIEILNNNHYLYDVCTLLNHRQTWLELQTERGFLETLQGDCRTPMGAIAKICNDKINATFFYAEQDGSDIKIYNDLCSLNDGYELGKKIANKVR